MTGPVATLGGRQSRVEILLGADRCPDDAPLIGPSELGMAPLGLALQDHQLPHDLERLIESMRAAQDGALVAIVDAPPAPRRLGIVQSNRSENPNFYELHRPDKRLWRDFYHRTTYALLQRVDDAWRAEDIELSHPTGHDWPPDLLPTVMEVLGHLADERALAVKRVHLSCCLHRLREPAAISAMRQLNREQASSSPPAHRNVDVTDVSVEQLLGTDVSGVHLFRIDL